MELFGLTCIVSEITDLFHTFYPHILKIQFLSEYRNVRRTILMFRKFKTRNNLYCQNTYILLNFIASEIRICSSECQFFNWQSTARYLCKFFTNTERHLKFQSKRLHSTFHALANRTGAIKAPILCFSGYSTQSLVCHPLTPLPTPPINGISCILSTVA